MKQWQTRVLLVITFTIFETRAEVFSAVSEMECLLRTQKSVMNSLDHLVNKKNCKIKTVKKYLDLCKQEHDLAAKDPHKYLGNPINCFKLIKRLSVDLDHVESILNERTDFVKNASLIYPTQIDLDGAADAILRLETVYKLNITHLADGLWGTAYGLPMTTSDCMELGKALFRVKYYHPGIHWLTEALRKYEEGVNDDGRYSKEEILLELSNGYNALDDFIKNFVAWMTSLEALYPKAHELISIDHLIGSYRRGVTPEETLKDIPTEDSLHPTTKQRSGHQWKELELKDNGQGYFALCRGEYELPTRMSRRLSCFYTFGPNPFLAIAPVRTELLHRAPDVMLYHDILSDAEVRTIVDMAKPELERGQVTNGKSDQSIPDRICKVTFLNDSAIVRRVRQRISDFSGLDLTQSGKLQVANYGIGGHYGPHYDFWKNESYIEAKGNRIATTLFYLSDVEQGGATVFTKLGVTVVPAKGAALFWTNLLPSGKGDYRTLHAACPVLMGSKWVMTQWINSRNQNFKEECY